MNDIDNNIKDIIQEDQLNFDIDPSSIYRLKNHMRITSGRSNIRMNSFLPSFKLQSIRPLSGIKVGIACLIIFTFFGYQQITSYTGATTLVDTSMTNAVADTIFFSNNDTIRTKL